MTYGHQGVAKHGVNKGEHAVAYSTKDPPAENPTENAGRGEKPMRTSIRIQPDMPGDKLDPMSRIDYGRMYTIEHNVKVMPFGQVHESSEKDLFYDFRQVLLGSERHEEIKRVKSQPDEEDSSDESDSEDESDDQAGETKAVEQPVSSASRGEGKAASTRTQAKPSRTNVSTSKTLKGRKESAAKLPSSSARPVSSQQHQQPKQLTATAVPVNSTSKTYRGSRDKLPSQSNQIESEGEDDESDDDASQSSDDE